MKAYPELLSRTNLVIQPRTVRKQIEMIGDGRCAREQELSECQFGADVHRLAVHLRPQRIKRLEPVEQRKPLRRSDRSRQRLV